MRVIFGPTFGSKNPMHSNQSTNQEGLLFGRRDLTRLAAAGAAAYTLPSLSKASPSDEIRVGCVGIRSRGNAHIGGFSGVKGVRVVALCDVDESILAKRLREASDKGRPAMGYTDLRKMLEDENIDAISLATPNHLHALQTIWACQAGKHVYVEKPISHNIWEGRQAVRAAKKYKRIVQAGTQSRSSSGIRDGVAWIQAGNLGAITHAWGTCFKPRKSIGLVEGPQTVPAHVHWDLYCGPRGLIPLTRKQLHYDWHWQMAMGNGDLGNQGIHQMDHCRWGLGVNELAGAVYSVGGRFGYQDNGDSPNTQFIYLDYPTAPLIFEVRGLPRDKSAQTKNWNGSMDRRTGSGIGATIHTEGGYLHIPNYSTAKAFDKNGKLVKEWSGASNHFANFISAVRAGDPGKLNGGIENGHLSSALCHMGLDSHKLGTRASRDDIAKAMGSNPLRGEAFDRFCAHLEANGVDMETDQATLGRPLRLDPKTELYIGDDEANALARGSYAPGFEVPSDV